MTQGSRIALGLRRFGRGYTIFAVLATTSVLLFAGLNLVLRTSRPGLPQRIEETRGDLVGTVSDLTQETRDLLAETWSHPYLYAPWVGFREEPRSGRYVNIHAQGFRLGADQSSDLASSGTRVFVLGGSTTFGYGVDDAATIPARLELYLRARFTDRDVHVFNFGRGWYYSGQEVALLLSLVREGHLPDAVVMIDGLNEGQREPHYTEEMGKAFELSNKVDGATFLGEWFRRLPLASRLFAKKAESDAQSYFLELTPQEIVDQYRRNRDVVRALGARFGFRCCFFVQPVRGYRNDFLPERFRTGSSGEHFEQMRKKLELLEQAQEGADSFSMAGLLEHYQGEPFVDLVHYSPAVNDLLAGFVAERLELPER